MNISIVNNIFLLIYNITFFFPFLDVLCCPFSGHSSFQCVSYAVWPQSSQSTLLSSWILRADPLSCNISSENYFYFINPHVILSFGIIFKGLT